MKLREAISRAVRPEDGAVTTEYALLAVLIAVFVVAALILVRERAVLLFQLPPL